MDLPGLEIYLTTSYTPFTVSSLTTFIKVIGKEGVEITIKRLVEEKKLKQKVYGPLKIYYAIPPNDSISIKHRESQIVQKKLEKAQLEKEFNTLDDEIKRLRLTPTTEKAMEVNRVLKEEVRILREKYQAMSYRRESISLAEKELALERKDKIFNEYMLRKKLCLKLVNAIFETTSISRTELFKEAGVETDDMVQMPILDENSI